MATQRPIIFSAPMVRALLDGRKTQTRRLSTSPLAKCKPGDLLWVRENMRLGATSAAWCYSADGLLISMQWPDHRVAAMVAWAHHKEHEHCPSIHMPRWASRLTLEVTAVRLMPLLDISEQDAVAEGFVPGQLDDGFGPRDIGDGYTMSSPGTYCSAGGMFQITWQELHPDWDGYSSPEVVALTFTVHRQNIADYQRQAGGVMTQEEPA